MSEEMREAPAVNIGTVAESYRHLVLWIGTSLVLNVGQIALSRSSPESVESVVLFAGGLVCAVAVAGYSYLTVKALGSNLAWLWAVGMAIPCLGLVLIFSISSRATRACREQGIPVGFLGPRVSKKDKEA